MANGEKDLDVGRTELTLDHHPSLLSSSSSSPVSSESSPNIIKEELIINDPDTLVSPLNVTSLSKEDNEFSETQQQEKKAEHIVIITNKVENTDAEDKKENVVLASDTPSIPRENKVTVGENFNENHYNNDNQISELPSSAIVSPSRTRYYHGKKLNSCLKKKPSLEGTNNSKKRNVTYPEEANFVKEFIEPVDPWRDGMK